MGASTFVFIAITSWGWLAQLPVSYPGDLVEMGIQGDDFQIVGSGKLGQ
jgi:hypothetical protein